jgi:hypothetical protein
MAAAPPPAARGNVFTRKIGPLPMWAWLGIVLAGIGVWAVIEHKKSSSTAASTADETDASQVPQFVNQTYTSPSPPSTNMAGYETTAEAAAQEKQISAAAQNAEKGAAVNRSQAKAIKTLKKDQASDVTKAHPKAPAKKGTPVKKDEAPRKQPKKK